MNFDRSARSALIVACLTLLVSGAGFRIAVRAARAHLEKEPVPLRSPLTNVPKRLGDWNAPGQDVSMTAEMEESLGSQQYIDRWYVQDAGTKDAQGMSVLVVYYTGFIDAVPHVPDRCLKAGGWVPLSLPVNLDLPLDRSDWRPDTEHVNLKTGEPYPLRSFVHSVTGDPVTVRMPVGDFKLRTTEFRAGDRLEERIYAGYFFIANGQVTPSPEGVRKFAFDLTTKHAYYAKVQFIMPASEQTDVEGFVALSTDLAEKLLPHLMLCLPDWAEVETRDQESRASKVESRK